MYIETDWSPPDNYHGKQIITRAKTAIGHHITYAAWDYALDTYENHQTAATKMAAHHEATITRITSTERGWLFHTEPDQAPVADPTPTKTTTTTTTKKGKTMEISIDSYYASIDPTDAESGIGSILAAALAAVPHSETIEMRIDLDPCWDEVRQEVIDEIEDEMRAQIRSEIEDELEGEVEDRVQEGTEQLQNELERVREDYARYVEETRERLAGYAAQVEDRDDLITAANRELRAVDADLIRTRKSLQYATGEVARLRATLGEAEELLAKALTEIHRGASNVSLSKS